MPFDVGLPELPLEQPTAAKASRTSNTAVRRVRWLTWSSWHEHAYERGSVVRHARAAPGGALREPSTFAAGEQVFLNRTEWGVTSTHSSSGDELQGLFQVHRGAG